MGEIDGLPPAPPSDDEIRRVEAWQQKRRTMATERERDAVELLDRIYGRKADHDLLDAGMVENWIDKEIAAFIRKHGPFAQQLRTLADKAASSPTEGTQHADG